MKRKEAESLFNLAGIEILDMKALIDGYGYEPDDERFTQTPPRCAWWFVKTRCGWIEIGWRKRVISINWKDTPIRKIITQDDTTKAETYVHAWGVAKALEYLTSLRDHVEINSTTSISVEVGSMEDYQRELYGNPQAGR